MPHVEELNARVTDIERNGGGGGGHIIEDEGVPLPQRSVLNFTGSGVTVSDSGGKTVVNIPGGGGGGNSYFPGGW